MNFNNNASYSETWQTPFTAKFSFVNGKLEDLSVFGDASAASASKRGPTRATFTPTPGGADLKIVSAVPSNLKVFLCPLIPQQFVDTFVPSDVQYARLNHTLTPLDPDHYDHAIIVNPGPVMMWRIRPQPAPEDRSMTPTSEASNSEGEED
ncbi:hypothetical protein SCHPADRAFT_933603 [Schizopora paradoxa]|uniref:Uncharacterized protein n=1 Tax=Schizopora paradoxa TaxID=27342 RepID=A0A0H2RL21_9AGAM|nr:hypothetical protein SCHPADRAFT_933603 [Schizopora paradoxa]